MSQSSSSNHPLQGEIPGYNDPLTLEQLSRCCALPREQILLLVEEGIIEPQTAAADAGQEYWRFHWKTVSRVRTSARLQHDLGLNLPGVALALQLLERIERLERQLPGPDPI